MRHYECVYILDPALPDDELGALSERFRQVVLNQGGAVDNLEKWERRRLAYEVKGKREGVYYILNFNANPGVEAELNRVLGLTEGVLRHQVVRLDELALKHMQAQAAARAQSQAQAAAQAAAAAAAAPPPAPPAAAEAAPAPTPSTDEEAAPADETAANEAPTPEPETDEATPDEVAASKATETDDV